MDFFYNPVPSRPQLPFPTTAIKAIDMDPKLDIINFAICNHLTSILRESGVQRTEPEISGPSLPGSARLNLLE